MGDSQGQSWVLYQLSQLDPGITHQAIVEVFFEQFRSLCHTGFEGHSQGEDSGTYRVSLL
jgi:hypothetical protein